MKKTSLLLLVLSCTVLMFAGEEPLYEVVRMDNNPIVYQEMFTELGVEDEGENINGPTVIRIPDWIAPENRADSTANYYIYFAHHDGEYIRMAWAAEIKGPWHLYQSGSSVERGDRGVLDNGGKDINLDNGIRIDFNHLASPDAIVDDENKRIILYFHSGPSTYVNDEKVSTSQVSWVSFSPYGLDFYDNIQSVFFGPSYFRVFDYDNEKYALTNDGTPYKAPSITAPWTAPAGYDYSKKLWDKHPENPFKLDITNAGISKDDLRVRHTGVRVVGDELHVFYSRRGDAPERIQMSTIDMSVGDWEDWDASYPPTELITAEEGWEGGQYAIENSETSTAPENVNQLRDPFVFEDDNDSLYLFYTGCGEDAIGVARLIYNDPLSSAIEYDKGTMSTITCYPNPVNDRLSLTVNAPYSGQYRLVNISGEIVSEGLISQQETIINMSALPQGVYLLHTNHNGLTNTTKIIRKL